jgi:hypothetical protein
MIPVEHIEILGDGRILMDGIEFPYAVEGDPGVIIQRSWRQNPVVQIELQCERVTIHPITGRSSAAAAASESTRLERPNDQDGDAR